MMDKTEQDVQIYGHRFIKKNSVRVITLITTLTAVFIINFFTPHGLIDWMLYLFPLLIGYYTLSERAIIPLVALITILMAVNLYDYTFTYIPFDFSVMNRIAGVVVFFLLAFFMKDQKKIKSKIINFNKSLREKVISQDISLQESINSLDKSIKEIKLYEEELEKSKQLYLTTINSLNACLFYINKDYEYVLVNDSYIALNRTLGYETEIEGKRIDETRCFIGKSFTEDYKKIFEDGEEKNGEEKWTYGEREYYFDTSKIPIQEDGEVTGIVTILRDMTENKEMEKKLLSVTMETEERERKIFSEDLHDGLGASLSTMKIYINKVLKKSSIDEAQTLLIPLKETIYEAIENTRNIAYKMTPHILTNFGLLKAIEEYCGRISNTYDVMITYHAPEIYKRPETKIEVYLYRILQELISNTLLHAEAKKIIIEIKANEKEIALKYSDDGKGFDKLEVNNGKSEQIGIRNIYARVKVLNGICQIESKKGKGMQAEIKVGV